MNEVYRVLLYSCPVALAALGETVGQRAGLLNIGLEGQMLTSAFAALLVAQATGSWVAAAGAAVLAAVLMAVIGGWFVIKNGIDQVVVGTAVNLFALGVTGTLFRFRFGQSGQLLSIEGVPSLFGIAGIDFFTIFLLLSVLMLAYLLKRTSWGLAARAAGEYPKAAEASGFSVAKLRFQAAMISGAYAGLAGAYLTLGVNRSFAEGMTSGRGFVAIAMVTFGRWNPAGVLAASLLVGWAESLQFTLQLQQSHHPYQLFKAMPYILSLLVLVIVGRGARGPSALALPYRRES